MSLPALDALLRREDLELTEASELLHTLASGTLHPAVAGAVLAALRMKGETPAEVAGFATAMRQLARTPLLPDTGRLRVDTCGTGGDGSHSLNLSTAVALLAAGMGFDVLKHGNRSVSSRSGSADVLEALGIPIGLPPAEVARSVAETGFAFLLAPVYHPAMAAIMPVRRALGARTVFNLLGPLCNPAAPEFQLVGAFSLDAAHTMAETLAQLPITRAFVVHGLNGWDEATPLSPFHLLDVRPGQVTAMVRDPATFGLRAGDLAGGDAAHNAARLRRVLAGGDTVAHAHAVALGGALLLELTGRCPDSREALQEAHSALRTGLGARVIDALSQPTLEVAHA